MPIDLPCPGCRQVLRVADHLAGRKISCPKCNRFLTVPLPAGTVAPPAPAAPLEDDLTLSPSPFEEPGAGGQSEDTVPCPGCGQPLAASATFCTNCGFDCQTGQVHAGYNYRAPRPTAQLATNMVRNVVALVALVGSVGGLYYAYTQGLFSSLPSLSPPETKAEPKPEEVKKETPPAQKRIPTSGPRAGLRPAPATTPAKGPAAAKLSLLVVVNERFRTLVVSIDGQKAGEAAWGQTVKLARPLSDKPQAVTFEARNSPAPDPDPATQKALATGLAFSGVATEGLRVVFAGPDSKNVPAPGTVLPGLIPGVDVTPEATAGVVSCKSLQYKEWVLKPAPPARALFLNYTSKGAVTEVTWLPQDCIVEQAGQARYRPPRVPYESQPVKLVAGKDGQPELAP